MKYLQYLIASILLLFVPIYGLLIAVATAIVLDTFTGVFKSVKINGWKSIRSRKLSNIVSKMLLYEVCILLLFLMDKYLLNEFIVLSFGIEYMFTKICAILLIFIELVSVKENIEEAYNIDIWAMLKKLLSRAKEINSDINDLK
jgi:hypothetical protein